MLKYHTVSCFMWDFTGDQFFTNDLTSESAICWRVKGALSARDESVSHGMQVRSRFNELFLKHTETNKHPLERETELTWEAAVMSAEELLWLICLIQNDQDLSVQTTREADAFDSRVHDGNSRTCVWRRVNSLYLFLSRNSGETRSRSNAPFFPKARVHTNLSPKSSYMIYTIIMIYIKMYMTYCGK